MEEMHPEEGFRIGDYSIIVSIERKSLELWKLNTEVPDPEESEYAKIGDEIINVSECHDLIASYEIHPDYILILYDLINSILYIESLSDDIKEER